LPPPIFNFQRAAPKAFEAHKPHFTTFSWEYNPAVSRVSVSIRAVWAIRGYSSGPHMESEPTTDCQDVTDMAIALSQTYVPCTMQVAKSKKATKKRPGNARLSPKELRRLADRLVVAKNPGEVTQLKDEMERGFCGDLENA
jgi:hypothetical protein